MTAEISRPRLLFVGGCPRSGTTLVQQVLDSHSKVAGGPEFDFARHIAGLWSHMDAATRRGRTSFFYGPEQLRAAFVSLFDVLLVDALLAEGVEIVSEKTPRNVMAFPELARLLPDALFLLVVRDPRAIAASLLEVRARAVAHDEPPPELAHSFAAALATITSYAAASVRAREELGSRVVEVGYEDLVREPRPAIGRLCAALGIDVEDAMLSPHEADHPRDSTGPTPWRDPETDGRPLDPARIDRWRDVLSPFQAKVIESRFADHPLYTQYFSGPRVHPGYRVATRALRATPAASKARRLLRS